MDNVALESTVRSVCPLQLSPLQLSPSQLSPSPYLHSLKDALCAGRPGCPTFNSHSAGGDKCYDRRYGSPGCLPTPGRVVFSGQRTLILAVLQDREHPLVYSRSTRKID